MDSNPADIYRTWDYHIKYFDILDSTNAYAIANAAKLCDKDIIVAGIQTAGRGRFDRQWICDTPGNICCSIVLKPDGDCTKLPLSNLTQYTAVCLSRVLSRYGVKSAIKWPNDVKVDGKKISGILTRTSFAGMKLSAAAVGIGININQSAEVLAALSQPATSLNLILGKAVSQTDVLHLFLDTFFADYDTFMAAGFPFIKHEYISQCLSLGKHLTVSTIAGTVTGYAEGIDDDGALIIRTEDGVRHLTEGES